MKQSRAAWRQRVNSSTVKMANKFLGKELDDIWHEKCLPISITTVKTETCMHKLD
jgi:hypothetical protein